MVGVSAFRAAASVIGRGASIPGSGLRRPRCESGGQLRVRATPLAGSVMCVRRARAGSSGATSVIGANELEKFAPKSGQGKVLSSAASLGHPEPFRGARETRRSMRFGNLGRVGNTHRPAAVRLDKDGPMFCRML